MSFTNRRWITLPVLIKCAALLCLLMSPVFTQTSVRENNVIDADALISSLEIAKTDRTPISRIAQLIRKHGVNFQLTPEIENRIRTAGSYLSKNSLDNLIEVVRINYRPADKSSATPVQTPTPLSPVPKWPMVGDDSVDSVRKRLNDLENRPFEMTENELAQELKRLFYRTSYSYAGEESPERFLFALCTTRPMLQHYVSAFKSSAQVRLAIQMSIQKIILLRDQIAELYGNVFMQGVEDHCERYREWQSFRQAMPPRSKDSTGPAYVTKTCGTLRDLQSALLSVGFVDSNTACPNIKTSGPEVIASEARSSAHSLSLHVDEITVLDNGEETKVVWTFDVYLGDKNNERLAAQIQKREYNLHNNQLPYHDNNPPQNKQDLTINGDAVVIRVEARRSKKNVVLYGKQEMHLNDALNGIVIPVNPPPSTAGDRSLGQFVVIVSLIKK